MCRSHGDVLSLGRAAAAAARLCGNASKHTGCTTLCSSGSNRSLNPSAMVLWTAGLHADPAPVALLKARTFAAHVMTIQSPGQSASAENSVLLQHWQVHRARPARCHLHHMLRASKVSKVTTCSAGTASQLVHDLRNASDTALLLDGSLTAFRLHRSHLSRSTRGVAAGCAWSPGQICDRVLRYSRRCSRMGEQ